jgi:HK97 family phage major capsid protein
VSENENLYDISARIEKSEPVTAAELRTWVQSRGPRPFGDGKYGQYTRDVVMRYQVEKLSEASGVKQDGGGRMLKADEQREFNRLLAEAGEIGLILNEADESAREGERKFRERFGAGGIYGEAGQPIDTKLWLPSLRAYNERKAMAVGSDPQGGYTVNAQHAAYFWDKLRAVSAIAGLTSLRVLDFSQADALEVPKINGSVTVAGASEASVISGSDVTLQKIRLSANKYAARTIISNELLDDSNPSARQIVEYDMLQSLATKLDADCLQGTGGSSDPIVGLRNHPDITKTAAGANGANVTLAMIRDSIARVEAANARPSHILMHPLLWAFIGKIEDLQDRLQLTPNPSAEAARRLFGVEVVVSGNVVTNQTHGSGNNLTWFAVADASQLVFARRQASSLFFDPFSLSDRDQVAIRLTSRVDFDVINPAAVDVVYAISLS